MPPNDAVENRPATPCPVAWVECTDARASELANVSGVAEDGLYHGLLTQGDHPRPVHLGDSDAPIRPQPRLGLEPGLRAVDAGFERPGGVRDRLADPRGGRRRVQHRGVGPLPRAVRRRDRGGADVGSGRAMLREVCDRTRSGPRPAVITPPLWCAPGAPPGLTAHAQAASGPSVAAALHCEQKYENTRSCPRHAAEMNRPPRRPCHAAPCFWRGLTKPRCGKPDTSTAGCTRAHDVTCRRRRTNRTRRRHRIRFAWVTSSPRFTARATQGGFT